MHVGVWTSLPVRNNQTWVHFHQNLSIFVIFQDFFQYSWASSRLFFNTLNKNTTVKTGKLLTRLLSVLFFALCCREKPASLFSSPEKRTLSSCKEGFDESHRQLSEERRRCCRWNPTPAGWSRTIWTLGDWAEGWWSVSDPIICTVHTHTHTGKCFYDGV